jgi:DNA polymerase III subunit epsilon
MKREYAIVDIETTGGNAAGSRITEIAIVIHDGFNELTRFETLVNPEKEIPLPIFALTGITNEMVRHAPVFDDIAQEVYQLLDGRIFVAHNVNFDYSFIRHQLEQAGFKFTARKLCTVRAARKVRPGLHSYSLGNLCRSLNIPIERQHRAGGDVNATAILFRQLLAWDAEGEIEKMLKKASQDQRLPPNLPPADFEQLPGKPGVYYFYNRERKVVYVGKAINLKKRVASHFSGHKVTAQRQNFLRDIYSISFEVCATELMALLLECIEIKKLWPVYNTALKRFDAKFGLYQYEARSGYKYLAVGKLSKNQLSIETFHSEHEGINLLRNLAENYSIDYRFCKYGRPSGEEAYKGHGLTDLPDIDFHNHQVNSAITSLLQERPSFAIIDKGRSADEHSCIWVENGHFYGMGYVSADIGFNRPDEVKEYVTPYKSNGYIMQLLYSFAAKYPSKVHQASFSAV